MKILISALIIISLFLIIRFFLAQQADKENNSLGLNHGHLANCPDSPNCINSEYPAQSSHYIAPLEFSNAQSAQIIRLAKTSLLKMGATIINADDQYLAVTFSSKWFKFVDDFELRVDAVNNQLHFRSASRLGYSDFGVNRQRVEQFLSLMRSQLNDKS